MNKTLAALAVAAAGIVAVPFAFAQPAPPPPSGWYANGQVGKIDLNHDWNGPLNSHDTGYLLSGGYRWQVGSSALVGVEAGYSNLGDVGQHDTFSGNNVLLGANGRFNFAPKWFVSARAGLYHWDTTGVYSMQNPTLVRLGKTDWYTGVGVGYDLDAHTSLGLHVDHFDAKDHDFDFSSNLYSVGVSYRF